MWPEDKRMRITMKKKKMHIFWDKKLWEEKISRFLEINQNVN